MNEQTKMLTQLLRYTYGLVPIVAGLDKFTNILTDWSLYISDGFAAVLPVETGTFMMIVGVIEIIAGVLVLFRPREGAYLVMAWLLAIALTLILSWHHVDVAVRDIVMSIGAFTLAKLVETQHETVSDAHKVSQKADFAV